MTTHPIIPDQPVFTVNEAAAALMVHPKTVYAWIYEGRVDAYRAGRALRIPRSGLIEFMTRATEAAS